MRDPKAMHFEVMIQLGPASITCRAEVSGKDDGPGLSGRDRKRRSLLLFA